MARSPYPGLRPFERDEADVFFGREKQIDAMVNRLAARRLLAVTGSSGSGKSSLVRAGLLEALETGLLASAGPVWRFAVMRPLDRPMSELAGSLAAALGDTVTPEDVALRRAALDRGPLSLVEALRERPLPGGANLLIVVDQFEELFRYGGLAGREEAEAFVALLLQSVMQRDAPIYVTLTMRSDFFGECARFDGLAEAMCDSLYLCPRLSRDQIIAAIEGPARVFGGAVEPALVARMVNDMGTDPDQLPLMQHALMRLWDQAQARHEAPPMLRLRDYLDARGLEGSLSRHADDILGELMRGHPQRLATTRRMFCLLIEGVGQRAVRRPTTVGEIMAVAEQPLDEITEIADAFRASSASLLTPGPDRPLAHDTLIDISHESLIRNWQPLAEWVREEAESAQQYRRVEERAKSSERDRLLLSDPQELETTLAWREQQRPNAAWAARYGSDFALTMKFIDESRSRLRKARTAFYVLLGSRVALVLDPAATAFVTGNGNIVQILLLTVGCLVTIILMYLSIYRNYEKNPDRAKLWLTVWFLLILSVVTVGMIGFVNEYSNDLGLRFYLLVAAEVCIDIVSMSALAYAFIQMRRLTRRPRRRAGWFRRRFRSLRMRRRKGIGGATLPATPTP